MGSPELHKALLINAEQAHPSTHTAPVQGWIGVGYVNPTLLDVAGHPSTPAFVSIIPNTTRMKIHWCPHFFGSPKRVQAERERTGST